MFYRLLTILLLSVLFTNLHAACKMKVRVGDYPPEYIKDANGDWSGLSVELAKVLLDEAGCEYIFSLASWKRAQVNLERGDLDMLMNFSKTPEREKYAYFLGPQKDESMVLVIKKGREKDVNIKVLGDIRNIKGKIAVEKDAFYGDEFDTLFKNDKQFAEHIHREINPKVNIRRLEFGATIGYIEERYTAAYQVAHAEELGLNIPGEKSEFYIYPNPENPFFVNQNWVYFGISKASVSPEQYKQLEAAFKRAKDAGKFEAVLAQYRKQ